MWSTSSICSFIFHCLFVSLSIWTASKIIINIFISSLKKIETLFPFFVNIFLIICVVLLAIYYTWLNAVFNVQDIDALYLPWHNYRGGRKVSKSFKRVELLEKSPTSTLREKQFHIYVQWEISWFQSNFKSKYLKT